MAGVLSTLGLGSQGALSYDIIDKLKKNDETLEIKPIERKIYRLSSQKTAMNTILGMVRSLKSSVEDLASINFMKDRRTDVQGDSVSVTAQAGAEVEHMRIDVTRLATREIQQSKQFASKSDSVATQSDTLHIQTGDSSFDVDVDQNTTLQDLADLINTKSDGSIKASILNTGGDTPYRLILASSDTGTDNAITLSDENGTLSDLNMSVVQSAQDASFTYDGISVTRGTNTIDDLLPGVKITLQKEGSSQISITQDSDKIVKKVQDFVDQYNTLMDRIKTMTNYDADTRQAGALQGVSEINSLKSAMRDVLEGITADGKRLQDAGIEIDRYGKMTLDSSKFTTLMNEDPKAVSDLFTGDILNDTTDDDGIFTRLKSTLKEVATGHDSMIKHLLGEYDTKMKRLQESEERAKKQLDVRYEIMAKKFASFDNMIGQMNNQFSSLNMLIQSQLNQKK